MFFIYQKNSWLDKMECLYLFKSKVIKIVFTYEKNTFSTSIIWSFFPSSIWQLVTATESKTSVYCSKFTLFDVKINAFLFIKYTTWIQYSNLMVRQSTQPKILKVDILATIFKYDMQNWMKKDGYLKHGCWTFLRITKLLQNQVLQCSVMMNA